MATPLLLLVPAVMVACQGGDDDGDDVQDEVLGILITPGEVVVPVGQGVQLSATGLLDGRESTDLTRSVDWESSDEGVLVVSNGLDEEGLATGLAPGTVRVGAAYDDIDAVPVTVTVTDADVERLGIYPDALDLVVGEDLQLTATAWFSDGSESDASGQARWVTGDGTVATITQQGRLTAAGVGSTTIHAEWAGVQSPDVPVTVVDGGGGGDGGGGSLADLQIKSASGSVDGGYLDLSVTVENAGGTSAGDFWVDVFVDRGSPDVGDLGDDYSLVTWLSAESTTTVDFLLYVGDGSHEVAVMADTNDDVVESDEGDNVFSTTVGGSSGGTTGGPDLEISYFDFLYDDADGTVYYYVDVINSGDEAAGDAFYVDVFVDRDDAPGLYEDGDDWTSLSGLGAGETTYADFLVEGAWCHWCWSWVMVDGYDFIAETDEDDNVSGPLDVY